MALGLYVAAVVTVTEAVWVFVLVTIVDVVATVRETVETVVVTVTLGLTVIDVDAMAV